MHHRVAQQHRFRSQKFTVVTYEKKSAAVRRESLNRVRHATRKKPKIVFLSVSDETFPFRVDGRNSRRAVKHDGPLGRSMPMQFADATSSEPHVYADHRFRNGKFAHRYFARPATVVKTF